MSGELLPLDIKPIPTFLPRHQHIHDLVRFLDIIQNAIVAQAKFAGRYRIGS